MTARDFAQTIELAERHGLGATELGRHGGAGRAGRARALASRSLEAYRFARGRGFDVGVGHGSNDLPVAARALGIPAVDMFDYEWAFLQHTVGCRLSRRVLVPDAIPPERLRRYGANAAKAPSLPGTQGGVLPLRPRARPGRACLARRGRVAARRGDPNSARARPLPPGQRRPLRRGRRSARQRPRRACGRAPSHTGAGGEAAGARAAIADRPAVGGRRPEPRRRGRCRRLGRRHDEPRGRRARRAGLHDVRRPARRGRRAPARGRAACAGSSASAISCSSGARGRRPAYGATPTGSSSRSSRSRGPNGAGRAARARRCEPS